MLVYIKAYFDIIHCLSIYYIFWHIVWLIERHLRNIFKFKSKLSKTLLIKKTKKWTVVVVVKTLLTVF